MFKKVLEVSLHVSCIKLAEVTFLTFDKPETCLLLLSALVLAQLISTVECKSLKPGIVACLSIYLYIDIFV